MDWQSQLQRGWPGRVAFVGLGNGDYGDDSLGPRLAGMLADRGVEHVHLAGTQLEALVPTLRTQAYDHVVLLDAARFGGTAGDVVLMNTEELTARFPQISTHKLALSTIARLIVADTPTQVWLLGVEPGSLQPAPALSARLQTTVDLLADLLAPRANESAKPDRNLEWAERGSADLVSPDHPVLKL